MIVDGMTERATFKQTDLTRALKGFEKAGLPVRGAKISPDGVIEIVVGGQEPAEPNGWDE